MLDPMKKKEEKNHLLCGGIITQEKANPKVEIELVSFTERVKTVHPISRE